MDKLKNFLRTLRRVHFWIICPLVVVMGLVGWFLTIGKLQDETKKNLSDIEGKFNAAESLAREQIHPNDDVANGMEKLIGTRRTEVAAAWQEKWDQQTRDGGVLTWPDFDWPENVKREFLATVRDKRPIEKNVAFPLDPSDDLRVGLRRSYRDYIQDELPKLAKMVGSVWLPSESSTSRGAAVVPDGFRLDETIVAWNGENQKELQDAHFNWDVSGGGGSRFGGGRTTNAGTDNPPTLLEILYAQEDLWVLRAVMQVIQRANANASARFNATVKEIEWLRIGSQAVRSEGRVTRIADTSVPETGAGTYADVRTGDGGEMYVDESGMGGTQAVGPDPGEGRYVDKDYKKLEENKLRTVMQATESVAPEDAYLVVAKRIPVRMRLKVDQRKFHRLLVECANSELTIEVREVRVNPSKSLVGGNSYRGGSDEYSPNSQSTVQDEKTFSYDLTVEIYGIVYIYNPVDRNIIGDEEAEGDADEGEVAGRSEAGRSDLSGLKESDLELIVA
jgi:hypothetical protein